MKDIRAHLVIRGMVQGVGFRWFAVQWANRLGLTGWVRNNWDGEVECVAEGDSSAVEEFITQMRIGPSSAGVRDVQVNYEPYQGDSKTFDVKR